MRLFDERVKYVVIGQHWQNQTIYPDYVFDNEPEAVELVKKQTGKDDSGTKRYFVIKTETLGYAKRAEPPVEYIEFHREEVNLNE